MIQHMLPLVALPHEKIICQGGPSSGLHIVTKGRVETVREIPRPRPKARRLMLSMNILRSHYGKLASARAEAEASVLEAGNAAKFQLKRGWSNLRSSRGLLASYLQGERSMEGQHVEEETEPQKAGLQSGECSSPSISG